MGDLPFPGQKQQGVDWGWGGDRREMGVETGGEEGGGAVAKV